MFIASVVRNQANLIAVAIVIVVLYPLGGRKLHGRMWWLWWMWHERGDERKKEKKKGNTFFLDACNHQDEWSLLVWLSGSLTTLCSCSCYSHIGESVQTTDSSKRHALLNHFTQFKHVETKQHFVRSQARGRRIWHGCFIGWRRPPHVSISAQPHTNPGSCR